MAIDGRRVLLGGLAAGVVINLSALLMVPVVGEQMEAALQARGVPPLGVAAERFPALLPGASEP